MSSSLPPRPRRPFGSSDQPENDGATSRFGIGRRPQPPAAPEPEPELSRLPDFLNDDSDELEENKLESEAYEEGPVELEEDEYTQEAYINPTTGYSIPVAEVDEEEYGAAPASHTPAPLPEQYEVSDVQEEAVDDLRSELGEESFRAAQELLRRIADDESTEVFLNSPDNIMFNMGGHGYVMQNVSFPDVGTYHKVINHFILPYTSTSERIGEGDPDGLIEGQLILPDLEDPENNPPLHARVHVVLMDEEPAIVTIAKKARRQYTIDELQTGGSMTRNMAEFIKALARGRATVVFSGVSGSGKTTLLEACSYEFDENDRVIVIEDLPELELPLLNVNYLRSSSQKATQTTKAGQKTLDWLVRQANRMRANRIIVGEVRGGEMADFFSAANSGADGSMTTVHANNPNDTIQRMILLAMRNPGIKDPESVQREIAATVQVIVQMTKIDGQHRVTDITEVSNIATKNGSVATQPIFQYDRNAGAHKVVGRPSDGLQAYLAQRGVSVDNGWFNARGF